MNKREKTQITMIRNERRGVITDDTEIKEDHKKIL